MDKRDDKAGTVRPSGGWRTEGVSLWIVCVYGHVFSVSLLCAPVSREDYVCVHMLQTSAHVWDDSKDAASDHKMLTGWFCPLQIPTFLCPLSHVHTSLILIPPFFLYSSYLSHFHFPLCVSLDPAFSSSLLSPRCIYVQ